MAKPRFDTRRLLVIVAGERPVTILCFIAPTLLAIAIDVVLRPRSLLAFEPLQWLNYFGSSLASAGFWGGPLWLISRLFLRIHDPRPRARIAARAGLGLFFGLFVFPLATFCYGGQPLYFLVFNAYMARDTVRLGIAMRGTLGAWLAAWGASVVLMAIAGAAATFLFFRLDRTAAKPARAAWPILPIVGFAVAATCFWVDFVESRSLQAAPPDTCFIHGAVHALRDSITHKGWVRRGITLREPLPLPPLTPPAHRPNVLLIVTESVRADALCSAPPPACKARFLDDVASERIPLGRLTAQAPGTLSSCVMLWTGMGPDNDMKTMLSAPTIWEVARAVGYRTAYIAAQNLRYEDFATYFERAGIDVEASAAELGGAGDPHLGAPDENATNRMVEFIRSVVSAPSPAQPYFATLHLSNTHWPYRIDPALQPFEPHDASPWSDATKLHNHYRNSVLLQERTVSEFLRQVRALPGWDDTAVIFVSDHGEEFREHGGMYHLTSLFDEQVRTPGWILAGPNALDAGQREALAAWAPRRTFTRDVNATMLDLLGVFDARGSFPYAARLEGRSLLRPPAPGEPIVPVSNVTGVWEPDIVKVGAMQGDLLVTRGAKGRWECYDASIDPREHLHAQNPACLMLAATATRDFPDVP
ncbi:MAG TPA: sulfatase-like hydrolase/transferase [Polyangiaceae bacterium]|nr:sulfatase-like hydrolase/transferase [Polyangiaceae bacterium]